MGILEKFSKPWIKDGAAREIPKLKPPISNKYKERLKTAKPINAKNVCKVLQDLYRYERLPGTCPNTMIEQVLRFLKIEHLYTPAEPQALHGVFGEGAIIKILDKYRGEYCLKVSMADVMDVQHTNSDLEHRRIMARRFVEGVYVQKQISEGLPQHNIYSVPRYIVAGFDPNFVIMEWIPGDDIAKYCAYKKAVCGEYEYIKEVVTRFIAILNLSDTLYQFGIVHRDIKPGNYIVSSPREGKGAPVG